MTNAMKAYNETVERKVYHICVDGQIICGQRKTPQAATAGARQGIRRECKKCRKIWNEHGTLEVLGYRIEILVT